MKLCPNIDRPERLGAIADFALNLGSGRLRSSSLRKKILANDWEAVPAELRKWVRGGNRVLRGLVLRREAEIGFI
jgi:lysozyme